MTRPFIGLIVLLAFLAAALPAGAADTAADQKKELQRIKREMQEKKQGLKRARGKERSILTELEQIDREIQAGGAELVDQQRKLREAEAALREIEQGSADTAGRLERLKKAYALRLRALYKMEKDGGYGLAVLSSADAATALKRVRYLGRVAEQDRRLIGEYGSALEKLAARQAEIRERTAEILGRKQEVEAKRTQLEVRRGRKAELLASVRQQKGLYAETLRELEESSVSLWAMIRKADEERKTRKAAPAPREAPRSAAERDGLPWPLPGGVLTRFGAQRHPEFGTTVFRRGIEIEARSGEDVRAVEEGRVVYADWYKGYGRLVILDHGAAFYTLYGHLSQLAVGAGDRVARGQAVGQAGETGSLKGPRLYFEVRRNGEAEDPLRWLARR